jgi:CubicO group peptidase (beta-lactamase class C family)
MVAKRARVPIGSVMLCSALALAGCAQAERDTGARIDALMRPYAGAVPGAPVLVLRDGAAVFRRAYGLADLEQHVAATPATNYRLASMTKQFTAAAVLALADDGRLSLDDPVRKWLPSLPHAADAVTIRQLLTHTSGLLDYEDLTPPGTTQQVHDADVLTNRDAPEPYALALAIAKLYLPEADAERASGRAEGPDPLARPLPPQGR